MLASISSGLFCPENGSYAHWWLDYEVHIVTIGTHLNTNKSIPATLPVFRSDIQRPLKVHQEWHRTMILSDPLSRDNQRTPLKDNQRQRQLLSTAAHPRQL